METTLPALRKDAFMSAVVVVKTGNILHQCFDRVQLSGGHLAHFKTPFFPQAAPSRAKSPAFGQQKRGFVSYSVMENETNPLRFNDMF